MEFWNVQNSNGIAVGRIISHSPQWHNQSIRNDTGMLGDDQVGGTWELFFGAEIQQPIINDNFRLVAFTDMGTITNSPGFDNWRITAGVGLRLTVPALTPVPLAFDFGFPIKKEPTDDTRLFTFTVEVPF